MTENQHNAPASFTETREFKEAVAQTAAAMAADIRAQILEQLGTAAPSQTSDRGFAEGLAMAIAQLTDQGTGRKRLSPEVVKQRADALEKMRALIVEAKKAGLKPVYALRNKVYLDEVLIEPKWIDSNKTAQDTEIEWPGAPNEAMIPRNDVAKEIFSAFMDSIGSVEKTVGEDDMWVTPGGLVIKGAGPMSSHRQVRKAQGEPSGEGVNILHKNQAGRMVEVRVLGTTANPALQAH